MNHPRGVYGYEAGEAAETAFAAALARGRLHHAWMLVGPEGVGKATFAYRAARRLLGAAPDPAFGLLGASPEDPVSRLVAARSHPDLLVLEREGEDGKARRSIPVDEARKLPEFFSKAPASAPWRVAIVDAADDLNVNAANAVLKTLEEPPQRGVLLLVAHAPGRLLPTIRSRCRRLAFPAWPLDETASFVARHAGVGEHDAAQLARMAEGSPGRALALAAAGALTVDQTARDILRALPARDEAALLGIAESFRGGEGAARFSLLMERLAAQVSDMALGQAETGEGENLDRWAQAWDSLQRAPRLGEALNLDRADLFWTAMTRLRDAARA